MTFAEFIGRHRQLIDSGRRDVLRPDFDILNAIELGRRHPSAETVQDLIQAARREAGGQALLEAVENGVYRLWAIYSQQRDPSRRRDIFGARFEFSTAIPQNALDGATRL